jgi:hypothetical protein
MTFLSFSTDLNRLGVENLLRPVLFGDASVPSTIATLSFPQFLPHPRYDCRNSLFSGIAEPIPFCTGSTTNTKDMNQRFCVVVVLRRQHSKEVGHAIQR